MNRSRYKFWNPPSEVIITPLPLCTGELLVLEYSGDEEFIWSTDENNHTIQVSEEGSYFLTKWNSCGSTTDTYVVNEEDCSCRVWVPSAFTPDEDGLNELFGPKLDCDLSYYSIQIFDSWGQVVFSSFDPLNGWNGNGIRDEKYYLPSGLYNWTIEYQERQSSISQLKGSVSLIL